MGSNIPTLDAVDPETGSAASAVADADTNTESARAGTAAGPVPGVAGSVTDGPRGAGARIASPRRSGRPARDRRPTRDRRPARPRLPGDGPRARLVRAGLVAPASLAVIVLGAFPLVFILLAAFSRSSLGRPFQEFVGGDNVVQALTDHDVIGSLIRSVGYALAVAVLSVVFGVIVALALAGAVRAGSLVRTLLLLPLITPPVVVGILWKLIFSPSGGLIDTLLRTFGYRGEPLSILANPDLALAGVGIADIWEWTPLIALLVFAALLGRDPEVSEAAALDGAHGWRLFREITLPAIAATIAAAFLVRLVLAFKVFDLIYVMTSGGPGQATTMPAYQIYQAALQHSDVGQAAALTLILAVVITVITTPIILISRRFGND
ncbi:carbohydrate ABC transporter permease [Mycetocola lacteus]|uniref:carbohydrate ABC transporter permease n=1 Tax=Mycetocola lacteus TaxID=76637 RepID=UPI001FE2692C|nr:sugar ABC transporter permease [Mycetocola lacteus]